MFEMVKTCARVLRAPGQAALLLSASVARAQVAEPFETSDSVAGEVYVVNEPGEQLPEVVVSSESEPGLPLDARADTGSRLGLTLRETPVTIDILTQKKIQDLGSRTTEEALNRAPGVVSNLNATSPGTLSIRGFTGAGRGVLLLYDGVRPAEEALFTRVMDSWLFERIEVLKGPASVDFGEGALAGVVNLVPKRARLGRRGFSGQLGYGSFASFRAAADANVPILETLAVRPVIAYSRSSGYVEDAGSELLALSLGATWAPSERLMIDLALDYSRDTYDAAYFGTPLIPRASARSPSDLVNSADGRVLDSSLGTVNFNVHDGVVDSDTRWLRSGLKYQLGDAWVLSNDLHLYGSDRRFINAEFFGFNAESGLVDRSTGIVTHDFQHWLERATLRGDLSLAGLRNRIAIGGIYSEMDFFTKRRFGSTTSVDLRAPERGFFPQGDDSTIFGTRQNRDSGVRTAAAFAEDALNLTPRWLLLAGMRYDHIRVDRVAVDLNSSPEARTPTRRNFDVLTWRVGSVYDLLPETQVFVSYSTAASPPSSLVALSPEDARFDMTTGRALEGGVKSSFLEGRMGLGLSGFYIEQDDIVTRSPSDPTLSVQGGKQSSRGVELSLSAAPIPRLRFDINYTQFDARFDELFDAAGNSQGGNTPERVPEQILNAFVYFDTPGLPMTVSVGAHRAGRYFTDDANTFEVRGYTTLEAALRYRLAWGDTITDLTLRGRNLTNAFYAGYTDISPDQLTIAPPQSLDLLATTNF
jgi:iron complex outermembrane receptor protein